MELTLEEINDTVRLSQMKKPISAFGIAMKKIIDDLDGRSGIYFGDIDSSDYQDIVSFAILTMKESLSEYKGETIEDFESDFELIWESEAPKMSLTIGSQKILSDLEDRRIRTSDIDTEFIIEIITNMIECMIEANRK